MNYAKDGITVAPILDTRHPKKNGAFPIRIRVTYARKRCYYSTGKAMTAEQWDALPTTKSRDLLSVRKDIESSYNIVREVVEELATMGRFSFDALNTRIKRSATSSIGAALDAKVNEMMQQERIGNASSYRCVLKGVVRFAGNRTPLDSVTVEWLRRYEPFR